MALEYGADQAIFLNAAAVVQGIAVILGNASPGYFQAIARTPDEARYWEMEYKAKVAMERSKQENSR